jgi:hypothetical protein
MREPTDAILFELEQRIDVARIMGGPPEQAIEEHVDDPADMDAQTAAENPAS